MQGNKRKDTKPELLVRQRLREAGLGGYRLQWKVPGHPDVAWPGKKVALFIHGCYWHRCAFCDTTLDYIGRFVPPKAAKVVDMMERVMAQTRQRAKALGVALHEMAPLWDVDTPHDLAASKAQLLAAPALRAKMAGIPTTSLKNAAVLNPDRSNRREPAGQCSDEGQRRALVAVPTPCRR